MMLLEQTGFRVLLSGSGVQQWLKGLIMAQGPIVVQHWRNSSPMVQKWFTGGLMIQ